MVEAHYNKLKIKEFLSPLDQEVSIIGGGPAGAYLALCLKNRGVKHVTVFEPRSGDSPQVGEHVIKCTGCAGAGQWEMLELLKQEGAIISTDPADVVTYPFIQAVINTITIHMPNENQVISMPANIASIYRGDSPLHQPSDRKIVSFDRHILNAARFAGANFERRTITKVDLTPDQKGKIHLFDDQRISHDSDLVMFACGHNFHLLDNITYGPHMTTLTKPEARPAIVREYFFGEPSMSAGTPKKTQLKNTMHIFSQPTPFFLFAAVVDKGEYITVTAMPREKADERKLVEEYNKLLKIDQFQGVVGNLRLLHPCCNCNDNTITVKPSSQFLVIDEESERVLAGELGDTQGGREYKNGLVSALLQAQAFADAFVNGRISDFQQFINRNYVSDAPWADFYLKTSGFVTDHTLLRKLMMNLIVLQTPVIAPAFLSIIEHMATGKTAYQDIHTDIIRQILSSPFTYKGRPIKDYLV